MDFIVECGYHRCCSFWDRNDFELIYQSKSNFARNPHVTDKYYCLCDNLFHWKIILRLPAQITHANCAWYSIRFKRTGKRKIAGILDVFRGFSTEERLKMML